MRVKPIIRYILAAASLYLLCINTAFAQELSQKQIDIIHTEAYRLLKSYEQTLNGIAENNNSNEAETNRLKNEFIQLFLNRQVMVYNDLEPNHQLSEFYEIETYISNLVLWYPDGLQVSFDFSAIETPGSKPHSNDIWFIDLNAKKVINGNYMNRAQNNNTENLSFRIAFSVKDKTPKNFRFVGIRNIDSDVQLTNDKALQELNKADYTEEELVQVQESAKSLVMDYSRALELIGNPNESAENKKFFTMDFMSLFESENSMVFNDLEEKPENELISIQDYIDKYLEAYTQGITNLSMNLDSANFSHIETTEDGRFLTYVYVNKFFSAPISDKQKVLLSNPLIFTITLDRKDNAFQNLTIKSIDKEYTEFTGINTIAETGALIPLSPIRRKGNSLGISLMGGVSSIQNKNINALSFEADYHEWATSPKPGYSASIIFSNYFSDAFGFLTGVTYSLFSGNYKLDGIFVDPTEEPDPNGDLFYDSISAEFDSTISTVYLGIPLTIEYIHDINKKWAFYINGGVNVSFLLSTKYKKSGTFYNSGYYPGHDIPFDVLVFEELGFRDDNYDPPETGTAELNTTNIQGCISLGMAIKTGYYSSFRFGLKGLFGISSVISQNNYSDILGNKHEAKSVLTNNIGLEISYFRKL